MGEQGEEGDGGEGQGGQERAGAAEALGGGADGGFADHGVAGAAEGHLAEDVDGDADGQDDEDLGEAQGTLALGDAGDVVPDGAGDDVGILDHQGRAQFGEGPDEDEGGAGEDAGHSQGEGDAAEIAPAASAEVLRGFEHGGVDIGQRGLQVEIGDGIEAQGHEAGQRPEPAGGEPVDALVRRENAEVLQEHGQRAEVAEEAA